MESITGWGLFCGEELKIIFGSSSEKVRGKWRKCYNDGTFLTYCEQMLLGR